MPPLAVLVFFLPTDYSLGFFDTLRVALDVVIQFFLFLLVLLTLPFTFCLSLFPFSTSQEQAGGNAAPPPPPPEVTPQTPIAWLEFLRSLLFWAVFIAIIYFAVTYYIRQNTALWSKIQRFPAVRWLSTAWETIRLWFRRANRQVKILVANSLTRLRTRRSPVSVHTVRRLLSPRRMSPRQRVIFFYLNLIELGKQRGLERKPSQTPYQYENQVLDQVPEINDELDGLTDSFLEARYSRHGIDEPQAEKVGSLWERIKKVLRSWQKQA
jgi:hypothetical protein